MIRAVQGRRARRSFVLLFAVALLAPSLPALAQGGPPPKVRRAIDGVVRLLESTDDAALASFPAEFLAPAYRESFQGDGLREHLVALRTACLGTTDTVRVERDDSGELLIQLSGRREAVVRLALDADGAITRLELGAARAADAGPPVDWETLGDRFRELERDGFSGVAFAAREGKPVLLEAYGLADRESGRKTALDTVYCIGSTPIDFTVTAIRLLGQRGKLRLDDTLDRYLPNVPADKKAMTIRHLMTGASGLPDFHHLPGKDWDADLGWIDRETAIARILAQQLLFAPGGGEAHSHSAFGLLAALIEIVSGESYAEFVRRELFVPAGMTRTGFYGESRGLRLADFATGYGASSVGLPNIPPNWGPTSWLVMGSGGMFSTLDDMRHFYEALEAGKLVSRDWFQPGRSTDVGGSDRGFYIFHTTDGKGTRILFLMNGEGRSPQIRALSRALGRLIG